jgi:TPP-dependent pyruvate/acetoin dehydrogenase alpha subunit
MARPEITGTTASRRTRKAEAPAAADRDAREDARPGRARGGGNPVPSPELARAEEFPPPTSSHPFVRMAPEGPPVPREVREKLLFHMLMTREVDDRIEKKLYRQGKIVGGVYTGRGQEAISVAFTLALGDKDFIIPSHRDMGVYVTRGMSLYRIFAQYLGRRDGPARGKDGNMHMGDLRLGLVSVVSMLADSVPIVTGAAMTFKFRGEKRIAITFGGEGATSRGDWHEGINLAAVQKAPAVFVINNNQYAYSTPTEAQYACENLIDRAIGYGIPGYLVDGNDAEAVYRTAVEVVERARSGGGPSIVECKTFRMTGHSAHDDPSHYVPAELFREWERKDPVARLTRRLQADGVIDEGWLERTQADIRAQVDKAVEEAEACPFPDPSEVTTDVYFDPSRPLVNQ